jgi:hypothetical protein
MSTEVKVINSAEEMTDLPNYALVVGAPADVPGLGIAVIALQKIADDWYAPGFPDPLPVELLEVDVFFPAQVVFTL